MGIHPPHIRSPHHRCRPRPKASESPAACCGPAAANPVGGAGGTPYPQATPPKFNTAFPCSIQGATSNPISPPSRETANPPRPERLAAEDGPASNSGGGAGPPDETSATQPEFIMQSSAVSRAPASIPISPSPAPAPIRRRRRSHRAARYGPAGIRDAGEGAVASDSPASIMHCSAVSQGAYDPQADFRIVH
jgi:hypothetical protein